MHRTHADDQAHAASHWCLSAWLTGACAWACLAWVVSPPRQPAGAAEPPKRSSCSSTHTGQRAGHADDQRPPSGPIKRSTHASLQGRAPEPAAAPSASSRATPEHERPSSFADAGLLHSPATGRAHAECRRGRLVRRLRVHGPTSEPEPSPGPRWPLAVTSRLQLQGGGRDPTRRVSHANDTSTREEEDDSPETRARASTPNSRGTSTPSATRVA